MFLSLAHVNAFVAITLAFGFAKLFAIRCVLALAVIMPKQIVPGACRGRAVLGARAFWPCALQAPRRGPLKSPEALKP